MAGGQLDQQKQLAAALRRLDVLTRLDSFDPNEPNSKPTASQLEFIKDFGTVPIQWIAAANRSGKSQSCGRVIGWMITGRYPEYFTWRPPQSWIDEGLLILIAARTGKHIEESLWPKIKVCLPSDGTYYKEVKVGNILQKVEILDGPLKGSRIVFQSLENPNLARERLQSYDAHIAWLDELVDSPTLISELTLRVTTKGGCFLASFTPLLPSPQVKRMVDGAALPMAKRYTFRTLDNPVFADPAKRELLLASLADLSPEERATRLDGAWSQGDGHVYQFDYDTMVRMPEEYSPLWRHVEVVDPATQSKLGLGVFAEDPKSGHWYLVRADYISGLYVPTKIIEEVARRTATVNVVRMISDPEASWYINQAAAEPYRRTYMGVYKKSGRKQELITGLQEALGKWLFLSPHCQEAIEELQTCRKGENGKIINGSRFHLADCLQYFADMPPKRESVKGVIDSTTPWQQQLRAANEKRKQAEHDKKEVIKKKVEKLRIRRTGRSGRGRRW